MEAKAVKIGSPAFRRYARLGSNMKKALEALGTTDLMALPLGRHEIDGDNVFMNVVNCDMSPLEKSKFEAHNKYYDIHCPLTSTEGVGVKNRRKCNMPVGEFNEADDYILYDDPIEEVVDVHPGEVIIVGPEVSHAPCIGFGSQKKIIVKVKQ